ncbi:MAG: FkbM family methyltransferase [Nocardioidaceae bacterium]|nr:FkbM family methyltransferase [Nocardioidaceae bacterium]MCL2612087.1 FkbM family methyltransferase [Nocardioidaceae bacterium]
MKHNPRDVAGRALLLVNGRLPDRPVQRKVRGITMTLPRRHGLPYFARAGTPYAENLVDLARSLARREDSVNLLDVGANVGDSTMMVLDQVPGTAVCLEANPRWQTYLDTNLGDNPDVTIVPAVLVRPGTDTSVPLGVRTADVGSSIVVREEGADVESLPSVTTDELLERCPSLRQVRLIKSDTDGYDVMLVHAYLDSFRASKPVIFFEYDPRPTRVTTPEYDPRELWARLFESGYRAAVVWDNVGNFLFQAKTDELADRSVVLDLTIEERGYGFWDVAVAHDDDPIGLAVLEDVAH